MGLKLANNAISRLASGIAAGDLSLDVTTGDGALFPTLGVGDYHPLTLRRLSDDAVEIVSVTARSSDTFTITRAQEGTTALAFVAGDIVELRLTAATIEAIAGTLGATTFTHTRGTLTTDLGLARRTATLNEGSTVFDVDEDDVTDTASATETRLKSWKVGGVLKASIRKDGALHLWNVATDDSNYERGFMRWASNVLEIGAEKAGTGTLREVKFYTSTKYSFNATSTTTFDFPASGTVNIGGSPTSALNLLPSSITFCNATNLTLSSTALLLGRSSTNGFTIQALDSVGDVNTAANKTTLRGANAFATATTNLDGQSIAFIGGAGASASAGDADGGHVYLDGGQGYGTGTHGDVIVGATRGHLVPGVDNTVNLGAAALGWKEIFADNGTINTSDARRKTEVSTLTAAEIAAAKDLAKEIGSFKFLAAVEAKGAAARQHIGMTVQRAIEIMTAHGLTPTAYSFICYDAWPDQFKPVQTNAGEKVTKQREVTRQAFVLVPVEKESVEVIDGKPVLVRKIEDEQQLLTDPVPVLDEAGLPVMQETEDGDLVPLMYPMPRMESVTEEYEDDADPVYEQVLVRAAGDKYSFRVHELLLFIVAGMMAP